MGQIAAEAMIARLADWGVDTVFGLPGDGINGIMEGLRRHSDRVRFFLVHHEEAAAFMATAYAKATGKDRKSTRLNSSHANISYAVFCLKKKKKTTKHNE